MRFLVSRCGNRIPNGFRQFTRFVLKMLSQLTLLAIVVSLGAWSHNYRRTQSGWSRQPQRKILHCWWRHHAIMGTTMHQMLWMSQQYAPTTLQTVGICFSCTSMIVWLYLVCSSSRKDQGMPLAFVWHLWTCVHIATFSLLARGYHCHISLACIQIPAAHSVCL